MALARALVSAASLVGVACSSPPPPAAPSASSSATSNTAAGPSAAPAAPSVAELLGRADLAPYRGWLRYLAFRAEAGAARGGQAEAARASEELRLWTRRIAEDPGLLAELRGVHEWAYESRVDDSGQPFKLGIPTDYDASRAWPLVLYMHGYSGNHLEHAVDMQPRTGYFEASVLGRSRGGQYIALSEADVLGVLEYVSAHFNIDPDRVHLTGGSMGGAGTYWLASRQPHRFASGMTVCGNASDKPLGNLLTFPIYATHSDDDWTVSVLHSRGPLALLTRLGGTVVYDETTGYGHEVWKYVEGNERGRAWALSQKRPDPRSIHRLDFSALDRARRSHWAEIVEWGSEPGVARFMLTLRDPTTLIARLVNVRRLELHMAEAPFDARRPLRVVFEGASPPEPLTIPPAAPGERTIIALEPGGPRARIERAAPELPFPLHTPGGANLLYDGSPLLIVYGTEGSEAARLAMRDAATVASRSSRAEWVKASGDLGADGVPHNQNLYGELRTKPDRDVTPEDIRTRHLVLIGTAQENAVVRRLAARLPVRVEPERITFDDGLVLPSLDRALGLVHYNPKAPDRLLFWVAATDPRAYAAGSLAPELLGRRTSFADVVITSVERPALVRARSFDSRWRWLPDTAGAQLSSGDVPTWRELGRLTAESARRASGAAFAVAGPTLPSDDPAYVSGVTRLSDLLVTTPYAPVSVMTLQGSELRAASRALQGTELSIVPPPESAGIMPGERYRVALTPGLISPFAAATHLAPRDYEVTSLSLSEALRARFGRP